MFVSEPVVKEILEVIKRPELTTKFHALTKINLPAVVELLGQASAVEISKIPLISRDPEDNKFIATALSANADYLVSEDKDLLDLKEYKGVKIINTDTFIQLLVA